MNCLRNLRLSLPQCSRDMSLLRPTFKEKVKNSLLPALFYTKNNREPNVVEDRLMLRQQMASATFGGGLINSIVTSMQRTDYVRTLYLPDTIESYLVVLTLHVYPLLVRLKQFPDKDVMHVRKYVMISKLFEDIKARLMKNAVDLTARRKVLNDYNNMQQITYMRLEEGVTSMCGKELAGTLARMLYRRCEGGEHTMQQLLVTTEWLLETLDLLNSYSNDEFVDLCIFGEGFIFPLLGEYRPIKPDKLYTFIDIEELGGIPAHLQDIATVTPKQLPKELRKQVY